MDSANPSAVVNVQIEFPAEMDYDLHLRDLMGNSVEYSAGTFNVSAGSDHAHSDIGIESVPVDRLVGIGLVGILGRIMVGSPYLVAVSMAGAIVTEQGGLLCHAAVMAIRNHPTLNAQADWETGRVTFDALGESLTPVRTPIGDAWILESDVSALRAKPADAAFHDNLAGAWRELGRFDDALAEPAGLALHAGEVVAGKRRNIPVVATFEEALAVEGQGLDEPDLVRIARLRVLRLHEDHAIVMHRPEEIVKVHVAEIDGEDAVLIGEKR